MKVEDPRDTPAWTLLEEHAREMAGIDLADLLDADASRFENFSIEFGDMLLDYSRSQSNAATVSLLTQLAKERGLSQSIADLFGGKELNTTEHRAALHTALRGSGATAENADRGEGCIADQVSSEQGLFLAFADAVRSGERSGFGGRRFTRVINIGIGGSDLGPRLIANALQQPDASPDVYFVAGIDGIELRNALSGAVRAETLFIICSKTFSTLETRLNADAARHWLLEELPDEAVAAHFAAISVNDAALDEFGIAADARFRIWDWVGGRFSLWSAIGLAVAIAIGSQSFRELLSGAKAMDTHFRTAPIEENIPALLGLLAIWHQNFMGATSHVVLPYDQRLELLPAYLQQLFMESLGKSMRADGQPVTYTTGCPVWGAVGSHSQHSFAQLLHQGTSRFHVDYIGTVNGPEMAVKGGHLEGLANLVAQSEALARGQSEQEVAASLQSAQVAADEVEQLTPHKLHPGNRPSNTLLLRELTPFNLGALLSAYEHQVFVQAAIWGINPFDQWGVELGKLRAVKFSSYLTNAASHKLPGIGRVMLRWLK